MRSKVPAINGWFTLLAVVPLLVAFATACNKGNSANPEKAKHQRLAWDLKTTVEAYNHAGFSNRAWDDAAHRCLTEFAHAQAGDFGANEPISEIIATNATAAMNAGCNDPLVNYVFIKFSMGQTTNSREAFEAAFCKTARDMDNTSYPSIRRFYATADALDQINYTYGTNAYQHPEHFEMLQNMVGRLEESLRDSTMPASEAYQASKLGLQLMRGNENNRQMLDQMIQTQLFRNWPNAYTTWLLKGRDYIDSAWKARGGGYADAVTTDGWAGFSNNLAHAQESLEHAWKLDPHQSDIADEMITVMLGQGGGRDRMELWFNRAMEANTNDYTACNRKLYYLEPKWYGSAEDEVAFGRECVQSAKWGGDVPLTLVDAHTDINSRNKDALQANYWKRPDVWADIQAAYDRFFELNPDAMGTFKNYAWYAYHAEQWNKLNELLPRLGPADYYLFGGQEAFDKMVEDAHAHK